MRKKGERRGEDIVFQFILSSKEWHTNFYVFDHIIKLDGPLWVPYWPHKQNQQDGKKGRKILLCLFLFFSHSFTKFLLVWSVNKTRKKRKTTEKFSLWVSALEGERWRKKESEAGKICSESIQKFLIHFMLKKRTWSLMMREFWFHSNSIIQSFTKWTQTYIKLLG